MVNMLYVRPIDDNSLSQLHIIGSVINYKTINTTNNSDKLICDKIIKNLQDNYISFSPNYDIYSCRDNINMPAYLLVSETKKGTRKFVLVNL